MIKLYILPISEIETISDASCRTLFPLRMKKAEAFRFPEDRLRCTAAGLLLHAFLGIKESDLQYGAYGKPMLQTSTSCMTFSSSVKQPNGKKELLLPDLGNTTDFNLSHSGDYAVLALSDKKIGTDIERIDRRSFSLSQKVLTPEEQLWLTHTSPESFFLLWTMKESVCKALGLGLSLSFSSFSVLPLLEGKSIPLLSCTLWGKYTFLPGYYISAVGESPDPFAVTWLDHGTITDALYNRSLS